MLLRLLPWFWLLRLWLLRLLLLRPLPLELPVNAVLSSFLTSGGRLSSLASAASSLGAAAPRRARSQPRRPRRPWQVRPWLRRQRTAPAATYRPRLPRRSPRTRPRRGLSRRCVRPPLRRNRHCTAATACSPPPPNDGRKCARVYLHICIMWRVDVTVSYVFSKISN